jgi:hypothetical protein
LIQSVATDNNPIAFVELLRCAGHLAYQTLPATAAMPSKAEKATEAFPATDDRIELICEWWRENQQKYAGLEPLQKAIDTEVGKVCNAR